MDYINIYCYDTVNLSSCNLCTLVFPRISDREVKPAYFRSIYWRVLTIRIVCQRLLYWHFRIVVVHVLHEASKIIFFKTALLYYNNLFCLGGFIDFYFSHRCFKIYYLKWFCLHCLIINTLLFTFSSEEKRKTVSAKRRILPKKRTVSCKKTLPSKP